MPRSMEEYLAVDCNERRPSTTQFQIPASHGEPCWYASYTCSRCEKQVARILQDRGVECFLPLYQTVHRHKNGKRRVDLPLFPGYLFVHIALRDRLRVLEVPGVVRLVSFHGEPAPVTGTEIAAIRQALSQSQFVRSCPYVQIGQKALIKSGPLQGLRGKVLRMNNRMRAVLSVDLLHRSFVVDIDTNDLAACRGFDSVQAGHLQAAA
jgi:transcription antitermination factor NusG